MKKIASAIVVILLLCTSLTPALAAPETIDLETMTREELHGLIDRARTSLIKYELAAEADVVLYDADGIKVTFKGFALEGTTLNVNAIVENNSDKHVMIAADNSYLNGWDADFTLISELDAGKKAKEEATIYRVDELDVASESDLQTLEFTLRISDPDTYETLAESDKITVVF